MTKHVISIVTGIDVTGPSGEHGHLITVSESKLKTTEVFSTKFLDLNINIRYYCSCRLFSQSGRFQMKKTREKHQIIPGGNQEKNLSGSQSVIQLSAASASPGNLL